MLFPSSYLFEILGGIADRWSYLA